MTETTHPDPPEDPEGDPSEEGEDPPDLDDEDMADLDLSDMADEVEEATSDSEADDTEGDDGGEAGSGAGEQPDLGTSIGDMYVDTLAVVLAAVAEEHGDGEPDMDAEDIGDLARSPPMNLNRYVDELAEDMAGGSDLPPGKAAVAMTALLAAMVLVKETDLAGDVVANLGDELPAGEA